MAAGTMPGATVTRVEHGVPLMRSKWVHHTWAHQGGTQGQGTRLADAPPPSAPRHPDGHRINNQGEGLGDPPGPPQPGRRHGGLGDPSARLEARLTPGSQPPTREEDKLASPGWKLPEGLGTKKMEAPRGAETKKLSVSVRPPWKRWATAPTPSQKNT